MNKTEILIVDSDEKTLLLALDAVSTNETWNAIGVSSDENAIEKFHQLHFDVLLLAGNTGEQEVKKLQKLFMHQQDEGIVLQYEAGQIDALPARINETLAAHKKARKPSFSVTDDAFKIKVNIQ